jgi:hypothetical protein
MSEVEKIDKPQGNGVLPCVMHWVSVADKLPETNCDVLVAKRNGKVYQMSYHAPFDSGKRIFQWWGFGKWVDQHSQVTHWMRIPEPPCA